MLVTEDLNALLEYVEKTMRDMIELDYEFANYHDQAELMDTDANRMVTNFFDARMKEMELKMSSLSPRVMGVFGKGKEDPLFLSSNREILGKILSALEQCEAHVENSRKRREEKLA